MHTLGHRNIDVLRCCSRLEKCEYRSAEGWGNICGSLLKVYPHKEMEEKPTYLLFFFFWTGDKALDGYSKKKYVCKLLFIFLLGHDIDFGHMEAVNLLSSNKYTEKQIVSPFSSLVLLLHKYISWMYVRMYMWLSCSHSGLPVYLGAGELKQ